MERSIGVVHKAILAKRAYADSVGKFCTGIGAAARLCGMDCKELFPPERLVAFPRGATQQAGVPPDHPDLVPNVAPDTCAELPC
jgi:hypothetical protein